MFAVGAEGEMDVTDARFDRSQNADLVTQRDSTTVDWAPRYLQIRQSPTKWSGVGTKMLAEASGARALSLFACWLHCGLSIEILR